jgi:uncharacterized membrane protein YcaP (DUF421 family)
MNEIEEAIEQVLGKGGSDLGLGQILIRAVIIYLVALVIIRLGKKRLLGQNSVFDVILGIVVGSMFSRTIHSDVPFLGSILATILLVLLHGLFSSLAFRIKSFGPLVKGNTGELVKDGEIKWDAMRKHDITENDLEESMRLEINSTDLSGVESATLERNGNISFITKSKEPRIVEIEVKEGVQRIRLEIS